MERRELIVELPFLCRPETARGGKGGTMPSGCGRLAASEAMTRPETARGAKGAPCPLMWEAGRPRGHGPVGNGQEDHGDTMPSGQWDAGTQCRHSLAGNGQGGQGDTMPFGQWDAGTQRRHGRRKRPGGTKGVLCPLGHQMDAFTYLPILSTSNDTANSPGSCPGPFAVETYTMSSIFPPGMLPSIAKPDMSILN